MNKQVLILVRGPSGSGKSTAAHRLVAEGHADVVFEADDYFMGPDGEYLYNADEIPKAHAYCIDRTERALREGKRVVVANTFVREWTFGPYEDLAKEFDIPLVVVRCMTVRPNTHNVPDDVVQKMVDRMEDYPKEIKYHG
jgi:predicted kinase